MDMYVKLNTLFIFDNDDVYSEGVKKIIGDFGFISIVTQGNASFSSLELLSTSNFDLVITCLTTNTFDNMKFLEGLVKKKSNVQIMLVTNFLIKDNEKSLIKKGVCQFVENSYNKQDVLNALEAARRNERYYCTVQVKPLNKGVDSLRFIETLTGRERLIVEYISKGFTNKEIAAILNVSLHTVATHRKRILRKTGLHNSSELVSYAIKNNLI